MRGRLAAQTEVRRRGHQPLAKVMLPDAVDHDARRQRMVGPSEPGRQFATAAGAGGNVERLAGGEKLRHVSRRGRRPHRPARRGAAPVRRRPGPRLPRRPPANRPAALAWRTAGGGGGLCRFWTVAGGSPRSAPCLRRSNSAAAVSAIVDAPPFSVREASAAMRASNSAMRLACGSSVSVSLIAASRSVELLPLRREPLLGLVRAEPAARNAADRDSWIAVPRRRPRETACWRKCHTRRSSPAS